MTAGRLPTGVAGVEVYYPCCRGVLLQRQWVWMAFECPSCGFYLPDEVLVDAGMTNLQIQTRQCICESSMDVIEGATLSCDVCTQVEQQFGPVVGIEKGSPFDFPVLRALPDADAPAP